MPRLLLFVVLTAVVALATCGESPTAPTRAAPCARILMTTACPQVVSLILDGARSGATVAIPSARGPVVPGGNPQFNERGPEVPATNGPVTPAASSCGAK